MWMLTQRGRWIGGGGQTNRPDRIQEVFRQTTAHHHVQDGRPAFTHDLILTLRPG